MPGMDEEALERLLVTPIDATAAVEWIGWVVRILGPRFTASTGFEGYFLNHDHQERLSRNLSRARELLGPRLDDLVYRNADELLSEIDGEYRLWARPLSQPAPRLWLVERPDLPERADMLEPRVGLAFEDDQGNWWAWEPALQLFYDDVAWLFTDFYYNAEARTDEMLSGESFGPLRFTRLAAADAFRLIDDGQIGGAGDDYVRVRRDQWPRLTLAEVMQQHES